MPSYFLARHVYPCVTADHVVLLDLQRDKYVGVDREQMSTLAALVKGWPRVGAAATGERANALRPQGQAPSPNARADAVLAKMLAAGMLTTDAAAGKDATPIKMPQPEATLLEASLDTQPEVTFGHVVRFLLASALTGLALKARSIASVIGAVNARKTRRAANASPVDLSAARGAVGAFIRLRPLLFGAQDACLFDSLALVRFLSAYGLFPTCVIGVQTGPFAAHCWVQDGDVIFNDEPEYVRRFTPILAV
ncbi:MAG TPA: lasso peptide biosynthesis B2 protein [Steroidobacteraceae bacterium]|nr:lasso peptide biosynthesis B2 protein [Steroidobacteraceae bacterium]